MSRWRSSGDSRAPLFILPDADEEGQKAARGWVQKLYPKALLCPPNYEKETDVEE